MGTAKSEFIKISIEYLKAKISNTILIRTFSHTKPPTNQSSYF